MLPRWVNLSFGPEWLGRLFEAENLRLHLRAITTNPARATKPARATDPTVT
jgi:hypothetical protein